MGPGTPILSGTTDERVVTVDLSADRTDIVKVGDAVEVELADGSTTAGRIAEIGTVAESSTDVFGNPSTPAVTVTITLDDPAALAAYTNSSYCSHRPRLAGGRHGRPGRLVAGRP